MAKTTNNVLMGIGLVILLAMSTFSVLAFVEQVTCKNLDLESSENAFYFKKCKPAQLQNEI